MSKERKKLKDTALGKFLSEKVPGVLDVVDDYFPPAKILTALVGKNLPPEDQIEFDKLLQEHEKEMYALEIDDRKDARAMYSNNNQLQKVYALVFLSAYVLLTLSVILMIYNTAAKAVHVPDWAIGTISTLFGGMSMKVSTINDFLFGSSYRQETPQPNLFKR